MYTAPGLPIGFRVKRGMLDNINILFSRVKVDGRAPLTAPGSSSKKRTNNKPEMMTRSFANLHDSHLQSRRQ